MKKCTIYSTINSVNLQFSKLSFMGLKIALIIICFGFTPGTVVHTTSLVSNVLLLFPSLSGN